MNITWVVLLVFGMLFCHIVDDYYLQGVLAKMKQRKWWKEQPNYSVKYTNDYIAALFAHAFSWSIMIHVPWFILFYLTSYTLPWAIIPSIILNTMIHFIIDNEKANRYTINLITDQSLHVVQIILAAAWMFYTIGGIK